MSDPSTLLLAAIEETERLAHDAAKNEDGDPPDYEWTTKVARLQDAGWDEREVYRLDAHVAHNDPSSVLRRCAADRGLIEMCMEAIGDVNLSRYGEVGLLKDHPEPMAVTLAVEMLRNRAAAYGLTDHQEGGTDG